MWHKGPVLRNTQPVLRFLRFADSVGLGQRFGVRGRCKAMKTGLDPESTTEIPFSRIKHFKVGNMGNMQGNENRASKVC
jgi:hypothetical protein